MLQELKTVAVVWGMTSLIASGSWAGLHHMLGDELLFHSDSYSLMLYLGACGAVTGGILTLLICVLGQSTRRYFSRGLDFFLMAALCSFIAIPLFFYFESKWPVLWSLGLAGLIVLLLSILLARRKDSADVLRRVRHIGWIAFFAIGMGTLLGVGFNHLANRLARGTQPTKHVVFIVVDGLPTQYLPAYRPEARPTAMDDLMRDSWLLEQSRTTLPYTSGFFSVLYTGKTRFEHQAEQVPPGRCRNNLLSALQRNGVATQWLVFHRNGTPEGCMVRCNDYRGLRSYFLTEESAWIARWLGLDYHITLASGAMMRNLRGPHARRLYYWLNSNSVDSRDNVLTRALLPAVRRQVHRADRSFTLLHTDVRLTSGGIQDIQETGMLEQDWALDTSPKKPAAPPSQNRNRTERIQEWAEKIQDSVQVCANDLEAFFREARNAGLPDDVLFIVTADHGLIFDKGRTWKAYHPNPEVVRVPFFIVGDHPARRDPRPIATEDVRASLLDLFEVSAATSLAGVSIFSDQSRTYTVTLTKAAPDVNEWFLIVARKGKTYQSNIHPQGDALTVEMDWNDYTETPLASQVGPTPTMRKLLPALRQKFALDDADIHPAYR